MSEELDIKMANLEKAVEFYQKNMNAPIDEQMAVGNDDLNWLEKASKEAVEAWNTRTQNGSED